MSTKTESPQGVGTEDLLAELTAEVERTRKELWELPFPCDSNVLRAAQEDFIYAKRKLGGYLLANTPVRDGEDRASH